MKKSARCLWILLVAQALLLWQVFGVDHHSGMARVARTNADIRGGIKSILEMFKDDCGRYPTAAEGWKVLINPPADGSLTNWRGPYFDPPEVPKDAWGHQYVYRFPAIYSTNAYDLYSLGRDGISKSGGNDLDDIGNWDKPIYEAEDFNSNLMEMLPHLLWVIPILYCMRLLLGFFSPIVRVVMSENSSADTVWLSMALAAAIIWLLTVPQAAGR